MIEELGDILLHVVFHSQIGKEEGYFDLKEVVQSICEKLIYRHPHVFKNEKVDMNTYDKTWETLKKRKKENQL
ncbi:mazG nucleotide pyrophosphohydrolase domain protein [[Clostridium] sordellii ATCC 9714]|nr:mazG nucleotide pyrophosphohydrolase domain protein [[Clostridium] sordellii ATCC 9714] [Paeniclostridium sordellii ATCC 9714]